MTPNLDEIKGRSVLDQAMPWLAAIAVLCAGQGLSLLLKGAWPAVGETVWLVCLALQVAIRLPHSQRNRANSIDGSANDLSEQLLLPAMFLTMLVLPMVAVATPFLDFSAYSLPPIAKWAGTLLMLGFLWLFWRSHADLGRNWSARLEMHDAQVIVQTGVYARLRHPMYASIWLFAVAQPLLVQNLIGGLPILCAFAAMYLIRVPREEAMMEARFGEDWRAYAARTTRILPRFIKS